MTKDAAADGKGLPLHLKRQIDVICDEFEAAWKAGQTPLLSDFVDKVDPASQHALLRELVALELDYRRRTDLPATPDVILDANPELKDELADLLEVAQTATWEREREAPYQPWAGLHIRCPHCHNPIELVPEAPLADIDCPSCGSNFSLVDETENTRAAATVTQVGHFELVERLGMGAFGTVWKARDTVLDRTVAVKIPRGGQFAPEDAEKFMHEARSAARLRHPNIVAVHEVGKEADSLYIVSDFVRGVPLSELLADRRLSHREATELMRKIAEALHHAHENGVIHRDLKPHNIMIDDGGEPHLMDFGLAKRDAGEIAMSVEGAILGTPAYMSPEQARGEGHKADCRMDIYSLGVVFFQTLTGELPFRGTARMLLHKVINDDPPSPRRFDGSVPKDLETISLKCQEKDPDRRYQTSSEFADDLRRFLKGETIHARPVSRIERGWRWCKRNPMVASLSAGLLVSLLAGFVGMTLLWMRAEVKADEALAQRKRAETNVYLALEALDHAYQQLADLQFTGHFLRQPSNVEDRRFWEKALAFYEQLAQQEASDPEMQFASATAYLRVGNICRVLNQGDEGKRAIRRAIEIFERLIAHSSDDPQLRHQLASAYFSLGRSLGLRNAELPYRQSLKFWQELSADHPVPLYRDRVAIGHAYLGLALREMGRGQEAFEALRKATRIWQNLAEEDPDKVWYRQELAHFTDILGDTLLGLGESEKAEIAYRRAITVHEELTRALPNNGQYAKRLAWSYTSLTQFFVVTGQGRGVEDVERKALTAYIKALELNPHEPIIHYSVALAHLGMGETEPYRNSCTTMLQRFGDTESTETAHWVAWTCALAADAVVDFSPAIALAEDLVDDDPGDAVWRKTLGACLYRAGRFHEAAEHLTKSDRLVTGSKTTPAYCWYFLAMTHDRLGNADEAQKWLAKAVRWTDRALQNEQDAVDWNRRLTLELLRREAASVVQN